LRVSHTCLVPVPAAADDEPNQENHGYRDPRSAHFGIAEGILGRIPHVAERHLPADVGRQKTGGNNTTQSDWMVPTTFSQP